MTQKDTILPQMRVNEMFPTLGYWSRSLALIWSLVEGALSVVIYGDYGDSSPFINS